MEKSCKDKKSKFQNFDLSIRVLLSISAMKNTPLKAPKNKAKGGIKSSNNASGKLIHNNSRKRGKISYKEMESTDESSDDDLMNEKSKITPKKRKKMVQSDSE